MRSLQLLGIVALLHGLVSPSKLCCDQFMDASQYGQWKSEDACLEDGIAKSMRIIDVPLSVYQIQQFFNLIFRFTLPKDLAAVFHGGIPPRDYYSHTSVEITVKCSGMATVL